MHAYPIGIPVGFIGGFGMGFVAGWKYAGRRSALAAAQPPVENNEQDIGNAAYQRI